MAYDNSEREERERRKERFADFNYRQQYGELARFFLLDATKIYHYSELFAIIAVLVCGAMELVGYSILGMSPEHTVLLGVLTGSVLAALSLIRLGRKMFRTSAKFSTYMQVLVGYSIVGNDYRLITPEQVMDWISRRQGMSR